MEDQFYRKIPSPRRALKGVFKKAFKNKRRTTFLIVALVFVTYLLFDNKGVIARVRLESQKRAIEEKILQAETETKALQAQIKALEGDKKTIETIAREKYGMARDGETVYHVKKD